MTVLLRGIGLDLVQDATRSGRARGSGIVGGRAGGPLDPMEPGASAVAEPEVAEDDARWTVRSKAGVAADAFDSVDEQIGRSGGCVVAKSVGVVVVVARTIERIGVDGAGWPFHSHDRIACGVGAE